MSEFNPYTPRPLHDDVMVRLWIVVLNCISLLLSIASALWAFLGLVLSTRKGGFDLAPLDLPLVAILVSPVPVLVCIALAWGRYSQRQPKPALGLSVAPLLLLVLAWAGVALYLSWR